MEASPGGGSVGIRNVRERQKGKKRDGGRRPKGQNEGCRKGGRGKKISNQVLW